MTASLSAPPALERPAPAKGKGRWRLGRLGLFALLVSVLVIAPLAAVVANVFSPGASTWTHLAQTVLPGYVGNTLLLLLGVAAGVLSIGITTAWLVTAYRFPGSRALEWALLLPLAMPAYVMAYAYTDWLQVAGPVQSTLRQLTGWRVRDYWFPEIRSLPGAMAMLAFTLYPYVYLLARAAFLEQSSRAIEAGRLAGYGPWGSFFRVALPLARPGIAGGAALALMEALADYGTVSYFALQTFTTGIYRAWLSLGDAVAAAQLATAMLAFVAVLVALERLSRGRARFAAVSSRSRPQPLRGASGWVAMLACAVPLLLGFVVPTLVLVDMAMREDAITLGGRFAALVANSLTLAALAAVLAVAIAVLLAYAGRMSRHPLVTGANRVVALGYALPGVVIAVGILVPLGRLDNLLVAWLRDHFGIMTGLLFTGTIAALLYAYLVRFLAAALTTIEAGLGKVTGSMDDAARSLGLSPGQTLFRVHVPMLAPSVLTAALLVFVDVMKELPATFAMRPFNFDTLAVEAYNLAKDERLAEAAVPSLVIVAVGLLPIVVLSRQIARRPRNTSRAMKPDVKPSQ
jgi:iron(III) transport system permease protein